MGRISGWCEWVLLLDRKAVGVACALAASRLWLVVAFKVIAWLNLGASPASVAILVTKIVALAIAMLVIGGMLEGWELSPTWESCWSEEGPIGFIGILQLMPILAPLAAAVFLACKWRPLAKLLALNGSTLPSRLIDYLAVGVVLWGLAAITVMRKRDFYGTASRWIRDLLGMGSSNIGKLRNWNSDVRFSAARALGAIGGREAVVSLCQCLGKDRDHMVRQMAAESLGKISDKSATEQLSKALSDAHPRVRSAATEALGEIYYPHWKNPSPDSVVDALARCLRDPDWGARNSAVEALKKIGSPRATENLIAYYCRDESNLAVDFCKSLEQFEMRSPANLSTVALEGILRFKDFLKYYELSDWAMDQPEGKYNKEDYAKIHSTLGLKRLAASELARRGATGC